MQFPERLQSGYGFSSVHRTSRSQEVACGHLRHRPVP